MSLASACDSPKAETPAPTKVEELLVDHLGERATLVMTNVPGPATTAFWPGCDSTTSAFSCRCLAGWAWG